MFEIDVRANALRATDGLIARLRDPAPALNEVGAFLERKTKFRFAKQVDPSGNPWAPLAASTIANKRRRKAPKEILRDTGTLDSSITFTTGRDEVRSGTSLEYAEWLQKGTKRMPARPFLGFEAGDEAAIQKIFARYYSG